MDLPCQDLLLAPETLICSGNGVCSNTTQTENNNNNATIGPNRCVCNGPWSSRGDFRYEEGLDCDIYPDAFRALYAITLIGLIVVICFCVRNIIRFHSMKRHEKKTVNNVNNKNNNKANTWVKNGPLFIHYLILLTAIFHGTFDLLKVIDPVHFVVGLEPVATWVMLFANIFLFLFGAFMTNAVFSISLRQSQFTGRASTNRLLLVLRLLLPVIFFGLSTVHILCTVIAFYVPSIGNQSLMATLVGSTVFFVLFAFFIPFALNHLLRDMANIMDQAKQMDSNSSMGVAPPNLVKIHRKLRNLQLQFFIQPIQNGILNIIVATWPFLFRK